MDLPHIIFTCPGLRRNLGQLSLKTRDYGHLVDSAYNYMGAVWILAFRNSNFFRYHKLFCLLTNLCNKGLFLGQLQFLSKLWLHLKKLVQIIPSLFLYIHSGAGLFQNLLRLFCRELEPNISHNGDHLSFIITVKWFFLNLWYIWIMLIEKHLKLDPTIG